MEEHITELLNLVDKLTALGQELKKNFVAAKLLIWDRTNPGTRKRKTDRRVQQAKKIPNVF